MAKFFNGRRDVGDVSVSLDQAKASVRFQVSEYWRDIDQTTISCGASAQLNLTRRIGIQKKEHRILESTIGGSIGIEGLASIKSQLAEKIGHEVCWEVVEEIQNTFSVTAPPEGRRTDTIYQLLREYIVNYERERYFRGKERWQRIIAERTNCFNQETNRIEKDPSCFEQPVGDMPPGPPGGQIEIDLGTISAQVPFELADNGDVRLYLGDDSLIVGYDDFIQNSFTIKQQALPKSLLFLSDAAPPAFQARASRLIDLQMEKEQVPDFLSRYILHDPKPRIMIEDKIFKTHVRAPYPFIINMGIKLPDRFRAAETEFPIDISTPDIFTK